MAPRQRIIVGDVRERLADLPAKSIHCCVTSPPYYGLRDYGVAGQIGLEPTLAAYLAAMVDVFREVRRVLRDDGTCWLVIGDSYSDGGTGANGRMRNATNAHTNGYRDRKAPRYRVAGRGDKLSAKNLLLVPAGLSLALQTDGWIVRQTVIWAKTQPMPDGATDRLVTAHEFIFLVTKEGRYHFDRDALRSHVGHDRTVWTLSAEPYAGAHCAVYPSEIPRRCIIAGCPCGGTVLDPFLGSGTTLMVADQLGRHGIGVELNPDYALIAEKRIRGDAPMFASVGVENG